VELAFDERVDVEIYGRTLTGEEVTRTVPVCGPAAFIVLKALAFGDRAEPEGCLRPALRSACHRRCSTLDPPTGSSATRCTTAAL